MIKTDDASIAVLNALLTVCHDSQEGYETAAADVTDPELAKVFNEFAVQRMKYADELHERIRTLRAEPRKRGTVFGELHRAWMDAKSATASAQAHAVLVECERAEDLAVMAYRDALKVEDVDEQSRRLIQQHYEGVQLAHDRVKQLRDSATYAHR